MPHATLRLIPGVDQNRTLALNEAAISECSFIRFMPDKQGLALVQKLGGWLKYFSTSLGSVVRCLWAWQDTNANSYLAAGAEGTLAVISNGTARQVYPQYYTVDVAPAFSTTVGDSTVVITDVGSNIGTGSTVYIKTQVTIGGLVLFGAYYCTAVSADAYSIEARDVLGNPEYATSTSTTEALPVFGTTSGGNAITVTLADHGLVAGDTFPVLASTTVGGVTLLGNYIVQSVTSSSVFVISGNNTASSSTTGTLNGGNALYKYFIGNTVPAASTGYGIGGYGAGGYGTGVAQSIGRTYTTTAASGTGSIATLSFSGSIAIRVGSLITVTGVIPAGYNSGSGFTYTVTAYTKGPSTSTVSYANSTTGVQTVAGTITIVQWPPDPEEDWTMTNWGETLIACPKTDPIFHWNPTSGDNSASVMYNGPMASDGIFLAMPQRQIVAWGTTFNGIQDPLLLRWCDIGNYDVWIGKVTNQAGYFRIPRGSRVVGAMQGPQQGLVWTDLAIWSMQYVNLPDVYNFNEIATGCGLIAQKACGALNGVVYWMGQSQFYSLSSDGVQIIPCSVWDVVFQNLDTANLDKIRCAPNSRFGEVSWYYPSANGTGEVDSYVKYNAIIGQWDYGSLQRTAWVDQSVLGAPIGAGPGNFVFQHEMSPDNDGSPLNSSFRTGYFQMNEAEMMMFVDQIWPDMKWGDYSDANKNANVLITFYVASYPTEEPTVYGPYTMTNSTTYITPRFRGRLVSIEISSEDIGSFWRIGAMRYRVQPDGKF